MRHLTKAVILTALLVLLAPSLTSAQDHISDAARALKDSSVYVAPGTEGTNRNTEDQLESILDDNDNIVLIMLPASAKDQLGVDSLTIAMHLSEALENKRIIGLAVGDEVVAYAPTSLLDSGVAADQMNRADSVSNSPITALTTFTQNIHGWQEDHPQPKPSPIQSVKEGGWAWYVWLFIAIAIAIIIVSIAIITSHLSAQEDPDRINYTAPDQVKVLLTKIENLSKQVHDKDLKNTLKDLCRDTNMYFDKYSSDKRRDTQTFKNHLDGIHEILKRYIDIQDHTRYFNDPVGTMRQGEEAIKDFAAYVLDSCHRGSAESLFDYSVNAKILSAKRRS